MIDRLLELVVDESKWLPAAMGLALLAVAALLYRHRAAAVPLRRRVLAAMNLFFGVTIGIMAAGHLLAVSTKLSWRTLEGSPPLLYAIGVALTVPAWWLAAHAWRLPAAVDERPRTTLGLDLWLIVTLLVMGLHNLPLTLTGAFAAGYQLSARRAVGWTIVGLAVAVNLVLFVASLRFAMSGQSFEQFTGAR